MIAIVNGTVHTVSQGVLEPGTVLVDDEGLIIAVGPDLDLPVGADVIDASGLNVFPGFVDAHTHLGI